MKYYENLRLVYEMEARVRELRRSTEAEPGAPPLRRDPEAGPARRHRQPQLDGAQRRQLGQYPGQDADAFATAILTARDDGARDAAAAVRAPQAESEVSRCRPVLTVREKGKSKREVFRALRSTTEDQAERSLV